MLKLRLLFSSLIIVIALFFSAISAATEKEYMLKAGFLYNFARFANWETPTYANGNFTMCSPDKAFIDIADSALTKRSIKKRPLINKHIKLNNSSLKQCDMVFITSKTYQDWIKTPSLTFQNILLVGESDGFIENNGHIRFFLSSGKVRFEISPKNLKSSGLTISSKVLRLARVVDS
jgi:hypothetical protein